MPDLSSLEQVAVTGATGFIGNQLVRALVRAGCRPILLARSRKGQEPLADLDEQVRWTQIDLTENGSIRDVLQRESPNTLFHLAGTRGLGDARGASTACVELNFHATARLLEEAMRAGVRRIVMAGSAEEYGNQPGPLYEGLPLRAASPYGISKASATSHALALHEREGCPVVIVRPFSVYGPGQPCHMFVAEAVDSAVRDVAFKMSRGEQKRDLIFVEDVVRGLIDAACAEGVEGCVINLGTSQSHRLRDVAERIWEMTGSQAPLLIGARNAPAVELYDTWADITLARRLLKWEPRVNLESGLKRTIDFAREQLVKNHLCQAI
jgi:nucleoside-diphosphate-sugar epimerase